MSGILFKLFWMTTSFCNVSLKYEIQRYEPYFRCWTMISYIFMYNTLFILMLYIYIYTHTHTYTHTQTFSNTLIHKWVIEKWINTKKTLHKIQSNRYTFAFLYSNHKSHTPYMILVIVQVFNLIIYYPHSATCCSNIWKTVLFIQENTGDPALFFWEHSPLYSPLPFCP